MFATAVNDRFYTYTFQQRIGGAIDWYRVLRADRRDDRFEAWGVINDPDCCMPGRPNCPARSARRDLRLPLVPGRRRPADVRRQGRLSRSGLRLRGRAVRHDDAARRASTSARAPATSSSAPRPARSACASSPTRASTPPPGSKIGGLGGLRRLPLRRRGQPRQPPEPALRRLDRAAVPDRHGLRLLPHRLRPAEPAGRPSNSDMGEHQRRWSATSTPASRSCSAPACRRTGSSGRCSRTRGPAIVDTSAIPIDSCPTPAR